MIQHPVLDATELLKSYNKANVAYRIDTKKRSVKSKVKP